MKQLRGLLFDFNGTLFFDSQMHIEAFRQCFAERGRPIPTDGEIAGRMFGRTNERIYRENFDADGSAEEIRRFGEEKERLYREFCLSRPERMHLVPGAVELLDLLKARKIPFALATGSPWENIEFYRANLPFDRWFTKDNIQWGDGICPGKPAPDIYLRAAEKIGLSASECAVFEDGESGMTSAAAAHAGALVALYEAGMPSPLAGGLSADLILHDLSHPEDVLQKLGF